MSSPAGGNSEYVSRFGGAPLARSQRGIVISQPWKISRVSGGDLALDITGHLDPQELRSALLFWDVLEYPRGMWSFTDEDSRFLESAGVLRRSRVAMAGEYHPTKIQPLTHFAAFRALDAREPGRWSLGRIDESWGPIQAELSPGRGVLVELHQCIPVPNKDVPLHDILEFRARRMDDLQSLRHHLERVYQGILAAPDRSLALSTELSALKAALTDHIRVSSESGLPLRLSSLTANLDLVAGVSAAVKAYTQTLSLGAAALAFGAAGLSVGPSVGLRGGSAKGTPFRYVSRYHRELF